MSPSPDIHNVGFATNKLPHTYHRFDHEDYKACIDKLHDPATGGGSVTIPHKESVIPEMDSLSDAAKAIGAVNTVTKLPDGKLHGDNTDWLGIKNQYEARLKARAAAAEEDGAPKKKARSGGTVALLCGAGGTAKAAAYAFKQMACEHVVILNRSVERAQALAAEFGDGFVACTAEEVAATLRRLGRLDFVMSTLPGYTGFVLPDDVAGVVAEHKPLVVEASYIPRHTAFVKQVTAEGCEVIEGIEMLFEQGCAQCATWSGKPAPRMEIARGLMAALFTPGSEHPASAKMEPLDAPPKAIVLEAAL